MNKSPLPKLLLAILAVIAVWSVVLCFQYVSRARQARALQTNTARLINWQQEWQQRLALLGSESAEYAKQHPAMDQLLRSMTAAAHNGAPTATAPKQTAK